MHKVPVQELCFNCQQAARVTHQLSAGPPVTWGVTKSFVLLFWRAVLPCRCSAGSFAVLISLWGLQSRVRWDPNVALVSCLDCAPSKRTGSCLKWDRDLLLSYTELCVFPVLWCGSFSLPISSLPIRMTFFIGSLTEETTNSASSLKHSLVNVLWNMTSVVAIKLQWSHSFWNEKNMSLLALSNTKGEAYSRWELHGCQRWKKNVITFGNFIIAVNDNLMKWHCLHRYR